MPSEGPIEAWGSYLGPADGVPDYQYGQYQITARCTRLCHAARWRCFLDTAKYPVDMLSAIWDRLRQELNRVHSEGAS